MELFRRVLITLTVASVRARFYAHDDPIGEVDDYQFALMNVVLSEYRAAANLESPHVRL